MADEPPRSRTRMLPAAPADEPPRTRSRQYIAAGGSAAALDTLQHATEATLRALLGERVASGYRDLSDEQRATLARAAAQRLRAVQADALLAELQRYVGRRTIEPER